MNEKLLFLIVSLVCLVIGALIGYYAIPRQENYKGTRAQSGFNKYPSNNPPSVTFIPVKPPVSPGCGRQFGDKTCPSGLCCSRQGYCGVTKDHCCISNQLSSNGKGAPTNICNQTIEMPPFPPSIIPVRKPPSGPEPPSITTPPIPISGAEYCKNAYNSCMDIHRR